MDNSWKSQELSGVYFAPSLEGLSLFKLNPSPAPGKKEDRKGGKVAKPPVPMKSRESQPVEQEEVEHQENPCPPRPHHQVNRVKNRVTHQKSCGKQQRLGRNLTSCDKLWTRPSKRHETDQETFWFPTPFPIFLQPTAVPGDSTREAALSSSVLLSPPLTPEL